MNKQQELSRYQLKFHKELMEYSIPFWEAHGFDTKNGGIFTYLDRRGQITSHDKSGWQQGRTAWTFSRLCNQYGKKESWLQHAKSCIDFSNKHLIDPTDGRMFFIVSEDGRPIRKRRYAANEIFYINGNAEYYKATGDAAALKNARHYFDFYHGMYSGEIKDPYLITPKYTAERNTRGFGIPMCGVDTCLLMLAADPAREDLYKTRLRRYMDDIFHYFYKEDLGCVLENTGPNGEFLSDWPLGREINPGHGMEGVWFFCRAAETLDDPAILQKAIKIYDFCLKRGWDNEYGGFLMFVDALGHPPEKYEHDMKFWWTIDEAISAALVLYSITGETRYLNDFKRFSDYYFTFFSDHDYGGCLGYLRRDGAPTQPIAKGNAYKGPFHTPRMLMLVDDLLGKLFSKTTE